MSYLVLPKGIPDFNKAVISFWFRVPKESLDKVAAEWLAETNKATASGDRDHYVYPRLCGILPLMTFGQMFEGYQVKQESTEARALYTEHFQSFSNCTYTEFPSHVISGSESVYNKFSTYLANPSFIGIGCTLGGDEGTTLETSLRVRMQMKDFGSGSLLVLQAHFSATDKWNLNASWDPRFDDCPPPPQDTGWQYGGNFCQTNYVSPDGPLYVTTTTYEDTTELHSRAHGPESFEAGYNMEIKPDTWHHALISFDLSKSMTSKGEKTVYDTSDCAIGDTFHGAVVVSETNIRAVTGPCQMWIALDDTNHTGKDIFRNPQVARGVGPNSVVPENVYNAAVTGFGVILHDKAWEGQSLRLDVHVDPGGVPTYSYTPGLLPSNGFEFGIPCVSKLVDRVHNIELAEFQMWTGVTLDTSNEKNRRAFIDFKRNADGKIIKDKDGNANMKPVTMTKAEKLLHKKPEIRLHGSGNWEHGRNTGTLGIDKDGKEKPSGQFKPTGRIDPYKPDPELHQ